jgi:hypothetical protein
MDEKGAILDLRRMKTGVPLDEWEPLAMWVFKFLRRLNDPTKDGP